MIEIKKIWMWGVFACLIACNQNNEQNSTINKIPITEDLIIGALDQPIEHQLGEPVNVRTDEKGLIYIADRQSLNIKVFNDEGNHLKNISERGRGPGELLDIEFMEWNNDSNLVVMDRGNLRYTIFDKNGDVIDSYPYNNNFYPQSIFFMDNMIFALFFNTSSDQERHIFDRDLFHEYSLDFQHEVASFFSLSDLGIDDYFHASTMGFHPGSFVFNGFDSLVSGL